MTEGGAGQQPRRKTDLSAAVAAQLRAERAAAGVTLAELAERSSVPDRTLNRMLQHHRPMDLSQFAAICEGLDISPVVVMARAMEERIPTGHEPVLPTDKVPLP